MPKSITRWGSLACPESHEEVLEKIRISKHFENLFSFGDVIGKALNNFVYKKVVKGRPPRHVIGRFKNARIVNGQLKAKLVLNA